MRRLLLMFGILSVCMFANAEKVTRIDDFKDGESKFGFESVGNKKSMVTFDGEYMILSSKKGGYATGTRFPVSAKQNFKITYEIEFPKLDEDHVFGLIFNYSEDDENGIGTGDCLYITENKFYICDAEGNKLGKAQKIKLKKGKNVKLTIVVERKGRKTNISINGVDFEDVDLPIKTSYMGFCVNEKNTLKVDKIIIEQDIEE